MTGLRGLDLTFDQLSDEGYAPGRIEDGNRIYIFDRFGDDVEFIMPSENPEGYSQPLFMRTKLENVFPELDGAAATEAEKLYAPYMTVDTSGQCIYETGDYIYTITSSSDTLRGNSPRLWLVHVC